MHKIYDAEIMKDKADAIRYACKLPPTELMTPPEMADKLLQFGDDPGLVFTLNDYVTNYSGESIDSFNFMHYAFNPNLTDMDFEVYRNLEITFNIKELSYSYPNAYTMAQLNGFLADDPNYASYPGVQLLYINPTAAFYSSQSWDPGRTNRALLSVYQNDETGVCYLFGKYRRYAPTVDYTDRGAFIEHIIENAENKDVKIVMDKDTPNSYSVYVDGVFQFSDIRVNTTDNWGELGFYPICTAQSQISIGGIMYDGFGPINTADRWYPWSYTKKYDISFNHLSMKYAK